MSNVKKEVKVDERTILQKKADAFLVLAEKVHVKYIDGHWKRGFVKEVSADFFLLDETLDGMMPVFFQEISDIEKFRGEKV